MTRRDSPARRDGCAWCGKPIPLTARRDSIYCSTSHRQAAHRAKVDRAEIAATAFPLRIAYADPPYIGMARRYYVDHPDYAGEVDHDALLDRLATYDGWALSCSSSSVSAIAARLVERGIDARLAVWVRTPPPHPTARILTAWEGVFVVAARRIVPGSVWRGQDVLVDVDSRPRPTLPGSVIGMKPPPFLVWLFGLLGAMPGDELDDLFPGSGMVRRVWDHWSDASTRAALDASLWPAEAFAAAAGDA